MYVTLFKSIRYSFLSKYLCIEDNNYLIFNLYSNISLFDE